MNDKYDDYLVTLMTHERFPDFVHKYLKRIPEYEQYRTGIENRIANLRLHSNFDYVKAELQIIHEFYISSLPYRVRSTGAAMEFECIKWIASLLREFKFTDYSGLIKDEDVALIEVFEI